jgi:demethoxyubiquinone hydroxylase (CLK1/Coq7/Cat5 family)
MASDKSIVIRTFNTQLLSFMDDVHRILPHEKQILESKKYFETMKSMNPSLLVKIWYQYISKPYAKEIADGDMDFFINKDYSQDLQYMPNAEQIINVIDTSLRQPLKQMNAENIKHCKDYIDVLSKLANAYMDF